jgi:hypothetical protein
VADLDVSGLGLGTTDVPVTVELPAGITVVSVDSEQVPVTVTTPLSSPPASPTGAASPSG